MGADGCPDRAGDLCRDVGVADVGTRLDVEDMKVVQVGQREPTLLCGPIMTFTQRVAI